MSAEPLRKAAALTAVAGALLLAAACGQKTTPAATDHCPNTPEAVASHQVTEDPSAAASYWTGDRERSAKPAPMPGKDRTQAPCP